VRKLVPLILLFVGLVAGLAAPSAGPDGAETGDVNEVE
jgi:hypothetical protein